MLLDACADDAKSEVLHTKLFTLLLGERYRSHKDTLFTYKQGAWQMSPGGTLTAEDLEFLTMALRRAQAYFAHPIDRSTVAQRKSTFEPAGVFMGTIRLQINPSSPSCACAIISFEYIQVLTAHRSCLLARSPYFKLCFEDSQIYTRKKL